MDLWYCLRVIYDVKRLEVLEEYTKRQQWYEGPVPARRSHVSCSGGAGSAERARLGPACGAPERDAHYATGGTVLARPALRLPAKH